MYSTYKYTNAHMHIGMYNRAARHTSFLEVIVAELQGFPVLQDVQ